MEHLRKGGKWRQSCPALELGILTLLLHIVCKDKQTHRHVIGVEDALQQNVVECGKCAATYSNNYDNNLTC